jgi:hypothetical protein
LKGRIGGNPAGKKQIDGDRIERARRRTRRKIRSWRKNCGENQMREESAYRQRHGMSPNAIRHKVDPLGYVKRYLI